MRVLAATDPSRLSDSLRLSIRKPVDRGQVSKIATTTLLSKKKSNQGESQLKNKLPFVGVGKQYKVIRNYVYLVLPVGVEARTLVNSFNRREYIFVE